MSERLKALLVAFGVTIGAGGTTFILYRVAAGVTAADLADAGVTGPTHAARCGVRLSDDCAAQFGLPRYPELDFPIAIRPVNADGKRPVIFPPTSLVTANKLHECIEHPSIDDDHCMVKPCNFNAATRAICDRWGNANPYRASTANTALWVVPDCRDDAGVWQNDHAPVDCLATGVLGLPDGGARWRGCNVLRRELSIGTQCLDAVGETMNGEPIR